MFFVFLSNLKNALHYQPPHWLLSSNTFLSRQPQKEVKRRTSKKKTQQRNPKEGVKDGLIEHKKVKSFYLRQHTLVSQWDVTTEWTYCSESESAPLSLSPPPHSFLSSSQPTEEQGTAGHGTMCECEGHLTGPGLSLALTTNQLLSVLWLMSR